MGLCIVRERHGEWEFVADAPRKLTSNVCAEALLEAEREIPHLSCNRKAKYGVVIDKGFHRMLASEFVLLIGAISKYNTFISILTL